jgi:hypothetical protein
MSCLLFLIVLPNAVCSRLLLHPVLSLRMRVTEQHPWVSMSTDQRYFGDLQTHLEEAADRFVSYVVKPEARYARSSPPPHANRTALGVLANTLVPSWASPDSSAVALEDSGIIRGCPFFVFRSRAVRIGHRANANTCRYGRADRELKLRSRSAALRQFVDNSHCVLRRGKYESGPRLGPLVALTPIAQRKP